MFDLTVHEMLMIRLDGVSMFENENFLILNKMSFYFENNIVFRCVKNFLFENKKLFGIRKNDVENCAL